MTVERALSRAQVIEWNADWSDHDRELVAAALDAIPSDEYSVPPSGGYVGVWIYGQLTSSSPMPGDQWSARWAWHRALVIHPGWLEWPHGKYSPSRDHDLFANLREGERVTFDNYTFYEWLPLSTRGSSGPRSAGAQETEPDICPRCNTQRARSGDCQC